MSKAHPHPLFPTYWILIFLLIPLAVSAQPIATLDVMYSTDGGATFDEMVTLDYGQTFLVRMVFDNTGDATGTSAAITTSLPAGFELVNNSTRICLEPGVGETVCSTDAGMGGAVNEGVVWSGQDLTIAPSAGFFGDSTGSTSGSLEIGRKRFLNLHECHYFDGGFDRFFINGHPDIAGTNVSNAADGQIACAAVLGGYAEAGSTVSVFDLLGFRYLNYHECHYLFGADHIYLNGTDAAGTNTSNAADGGAVCAPTAGAHILLANDVQIRNLDMLGKRYINLHDCRYSTPGDQVVFNARGEVDTNTSTEADMAAVCDPTTGVYTLAAGGAGLTVLDLLDATRGGGYVEFEVTPLADGDYDLMTSLSLAETGPATDNGMITVHPKIVPGPLPSIDLQLASCSQNFGDTVVAAEGEIVTARIYFDNAGDLPGTDAAISTDLPAGFSLVPGSTRVCLEPSAGETVCNDDPGMGGAIDEASVWSGTSLSISPSAGLHGEPTGATSGLLEMGRTRYLNLHECHYYNGFNDRFFINTDPTIAGTDLSDTAQTNVDAMCEPMVSGYSLVSSLVTSLDLMANRYVNIHECQYEFFFADRIFINDDDLVGTNASNAQDSTAVCAPTAGSHNNLPGESGVGSLDLYGQRYLNLHECIYQNLGDVVVQNATDASGSNASTIQDAVPDCAASTGLHSLTGSSLLSLDMLDITRGQGYVEFQMTVEAGPVTRRRPSP